MTKAGGVTVSEALVSRLPMLLYGSIPGHEESNTQFLVGEGAALDARTPEEAGTLLEALLAGPGGLEDMRRAASRLRRPNAGRNVAAHLVRLAAGEAAEPPLAAVRTPDA
jgi:processive 1,2-diacylglycerol beta-glucosyltransferase